MFRVEHDDEDCDDQSNSKRDSQAQDGFVCWFLQIKTFSFFLDRIFSVSIVRQMHVFTSGTSSLSILEVGKDSSCQEESLQQYGLF